MNTDQFLELLQKEANKRGVTLDVLLDEMEEVSAMLNTPVLPGNRLAYVEDLVRTKKGSPDQADIILRKNPVLKDELSMTYDDSVNVLRVEYGIEVPDYNLKFDSKLNPKGSTVATGLTSWVDRTVTLPTEGRIQIPIIIAHEQGHAYHMEHSELYRRLKELHNPNNLAPYDHLRTGADHIIEGWAVFASLLYALSRDRTLNGTAMYERMLDEMNGFIALFDTGREEKVDAKYYEGFKLFKRIFETQGIEGAKYAANNLTTNEALRKF